MRQGLRKVAKLDLVRLYLLDDYHQTLSHRSSINSSVDINMHYYFKLVNA